jgi:hypothetical protein
VWRRPGGYVVIHDEFVGDGEHDLEIGYQFAPGALQAVAPDRAVFEDFAEVTWAGDGAWTSRIHCGGAHPEEGWICRSLGVRQPAPRLVLKGRMTRSPASVLTVLADCGQRNRQVRFMRDPASGQQLAAIHDENGTDWIATASAAGPIRSDAALVVCTVDTSGAESERTQVRGSHLHVDTAALRRLMASLETAGSR